MKGKVKAKTVDKYLYSIRLQIVDLIESNSTVIELGCGNGDLLFKLSSKIKRGVGVDKSFQLINYASEKAIKDKVKNLEFYVSDVTNDSYSELHMDYSIASLLFHVLPMKKTTSLIEKQLFTSKTTIICAFSKPKNIVQQVLLWIDQRFTMHYKNFRDYSENGFMEGILNSFEHIKYDTIDTFDPVIKIYKITRTKTNLNSNNE